MAHSSINIFLVCDYSILRSALRMLIELENGLTVVGEASHLSEASEQIMNTKSDLVLLDYCGFEENGMADFAEPSVSKVPILILAGDQGIEFYQKCLRFGISGLVSKQKSADVLYKAIQKVCDGELWFDRALMGATIRHILDEKHSLKAEQSTVKGNGMTDREKQVVELICKGMKNKGIAEQLFISETTVRHHLTSIFNKVEVTSRLELVIYAFKNRLIAMPKNRNGYEKNGDDIRGFQFV